MKKIKQLSAEEHERFAQELYGMRVIISDYILRMGQAYSKASSQLKTAWKLYHAIEMMRCRMDNVYCRQHPQDQSRESLRQWVHSPYYNPSTEECLRAKMKNISSTDKTIATAQRMYVKNGYIILNLAYEYAIDLRRCNTPEKILGWIEQLSGKTWMDARSLDEFAQLAFQQIGIIPDRNLA
jgi:hypothetical protein